MVVALFLNLSYSNLLCYQNLLYSKTFIPLYCLKSNALEFVFQFIYCMHRVGLVIKGTVVSGMKVHVKGMLIK